MKTKFMRLAIREAVKGIHGNEGGPFGAVVIREGEVVSRAHNRVVKTNDPTAHAEILAIRKAAKKMGRFDLSDCEIYATSEPCPMCLAAIHWAKIRKVFYGCTKDDAAAIRFDDKNISEALRGTAKKRRVSCVELQRDECLELFRAWSGKKDKVRY